MPPGILLEYELAQEGDDTDGRVMLTTAGGGRKNFTLEIKGVRLENGNYPTLRLTDGFMTKFCLH
jgi:hypothetical protein